jgi:diguanylate cyclase (GGDEF)-like protein/PAS domain S-box-containing protein
MAAVDVVLVGVGVFMLVAGLRTLTGNFTTGSSLWLANGFVLGLLLTVPRVRWPLLLVTGTIAGAGAAFYLRADPAVIPWFALANAVEVLVAAALLSGTIHRATDLTSRGNFLRFLAGAALLGPASLLLLLAVFHRVTGQAFEPIAAQHVLIGHALGMTVMTPVVLALRNGELRQYLRPETLLETLLTLVLLAVICGLVFFQTAVPLLFLIFPPMLRIAYRSGFVGTAVALLVVVAAGALATAGGYGPIAAMRTSENLASHPLLADGFIALQVFSASLLVSLFPLIVSIAEGRRAHQATEELQNRLRLLMDHSSDVIILTDLEGHRLYVSPAIREVIGIEPEQFLRLTWRDYVHELDRDEVGQQIEEAQSTRSSCVLVFRARHSAGHAVWIEARMKYFRDRTFDLMQVEKDSGVQRNCGAEGDEGFVVTMRDISARRRAELELESANTELASLIRKDSLTGLANRRRFDEVLAEAWAKALAGGWPIAVLMIDVDHFKQFNDCYGHQRGDLCLRDVAAAIITGLFHPDDVAARYGGEEFAVILPRTTTDNAALVAERIRRAVQELRRPHAATPQGLLTVSVGVAAAYPVNHGDPLAVVRAADEALYTSKNEGRNRTTLLDVSWPPGPATTPQ